MAVTVAVVIVGAGLLADRAGIEVCGRTTPCSDGRARAVMVLLGLGVVVLAVLAAGTVVAVADRLADRRAERRSRDRRRGRSGHPGRRAGR